MATATDTLTSATDRPTLEREVPDEIRTKTIEGTDCTDRAGVAAITGLSLVSINLKAGNDPDFPAPTGGGRINRTYWYPVEAVRAYAALLADRAAAGKPRPVAAGDPDDLLDPKDAAEALGISDGTFSRYVNDSRPYWDGLVDGRPILPKPDVVTIEPVGNLGELERRQWYRRTLAEHQETRPGRSANAGDGRTGRPRKS
jgi:hypothetical protein